MSDIEIRQKTPAETKHRQPLLQRLATVAIAISILLNFLPNMPVKASTPPDVCDSTKTAINAFEVDLTGSSDQVQVGLNMDWRACPPVISRITGDSSGATQYDFTCKDGNDGSRTCKAVVPMPKEVGNNPASFAICKAETEACQSVGFDQARDDGGDARIVLTLPDGSQLSMAPTYTQTQYIFAGPVYNNGQWRYASAADRPEAEAPSLNPWLIPPVSDSGDFRAFFYRSITSGKWEIARPELGCETTQGPCYSIVEFGSLGEIAINPDGTNPPTVTSTLRNMYMPAMNK